LHQALFPTKIREQLISINFAEDDPDCAEHILH
jgi:hypothetical protein